MLVRWTLFSNDDLGYRCLLLLLDLGEQSAGIPAVLQQKTKHQDTDNENIRLGYNWTLKGSK